MSYSSHIKANVLKALVQKEVPCEEKLDEIRGLLGLPPLEKDPETDAEKSGETRDQPVEEEASNEISVSDRPIELGEREKSINRILEAFEGKYKKFAYQILLEIEKSELLSWDYGTLELIIDSQTVLHSNLKQLLVKLLEQRSPTLPFGLHKFVNALIRIKLPKVYFKGSDARNIRAFLVEQGSGQAVVVNSEEKLQKRKGDSLRERGEEVARKRKLGEEGEEEEEGVAVKRPRTEGVVEEEEEEEETGVPVAVAKERGEERVKRKRESEEDLDFDGEEGRRRSKRVKLKKDIGEIWDGLYREGRR